jgi:soluble lytic murein transglycosylase-like protein
MTNNEKTVLMLLGAAGIAYWWWSQSSSTSTSGSPSDATSFLNNPLAAVAELVTPWKSAGQASTWLPLLNTAEQTAGIPTDLLARIAYQESRFREDVIRGTTPSSAGALGMMQLMPQYFLSVRQPIPFMDTDVGNQITEAANYLAANYAQLGDWALATAAYNAGVAAVKKYGGVPPFPETQQYVAQITADLPGLV